MLILQLQMTTSSSDTSGLDFCPNQKGFKRTEVNEFGSIMNMKWKAVCKNFQHSFLSYIINICFY